MAYLGNKSGPRESQIINDLGPQYFGITPAQLEQDIDNFRFGESRGEVVPVRVDKKGNYYIIFRTAKGPMKFYLKGKYKLHGKVLTH